MAQYRRDGSYQTEKWVLDSSGQLSSRSHYVDPQITDIDVILNNLSSTDTAMASHPGLTSSLTQIEQLVKKQLSFTEDDSDDNTTPQTEGEAADGEAAEGEVAEGDEEGVFDKPLTEERQQGMRAVQSTLERLDSKHGVLQRHASAECVRDPSDETDYLKRTMSDSIRRPSNPSVEDGAQSLQKRDTPTDASSEPSRSRKSSNGAPSRIPQPGSSQQQTATSPVKPVVKTPLTTNRTIPMTSSSTPKAHVLQDPSRPLRVAPDNSVYNKDFQETSDKAPSMRQLLVESKAETSDLRRQIEELVSENNKLRGNKSGLSNGHSSTESVSHIHGKLAESERRCDMLLREKENLATELWKLRQQVEDMINNRSEFGSELGESVISSQQQKLDSYRPSNPEPMQRRIGDLESQLQDLHEANETSSAEVLRLDQENQMLTSHIKRLNASLDTDVEAERQLLHQQLEELRQKQEQNSYDDVMHLRSEMAQLRVDLKATHEKSNILQDENVTLRETIRELKSNNRWKGSGSSVNDNTDRDRQTDSRTKEAAWDEINNLKQRIREFSSRNPIISPASRSPESKRSFVTRTSAYDRPTSYKQPLLSAAYSPTSQRKEYKSSYQTSHQSSEDRPPSPSGRSDISESTTILMAGFESYKPLSRSAHSRSLPLRKIEDDRISECTMDILNEATFNSAAFSAYDVNDDVTMDSRNESSYNHIRRGSVGSDSVRSESTQDLLSERLAPPPSYGLRSVLAPVLPTQHNKSSLSSTSSLSRVGLSTAGRRPFAPRSPADLAIADIAKFTKPDGRICKGLIKFIGHLHDKNETYIGLELEHQDGKHDGMYDGVRYFDCKPNRGVFITFNKIIMVWGS